MEIQVVFDREDRCYRFGEEVSGKVVIEAKEDVQCSGVSLSYGWRTHGRGTRDEGDKKGLTLAHEDISFRAGEHKDFPFHFKAPDGPVTYHGGNLNVDWYVSAQTISSSGSFFEEEQDFLLVGGDSEGGVMLGDREIAAKDLPARSPASTAGLVEVQAAGAKDSTFKPTKRSTAFFLFWWVLIFSFICAASIGLGLALSFGVALGISAAAVTLFYILPKVFNYVSRQRFEVSELRVDPEMIYVGDQANLHLDFHMKGDLYLRNIAVTLYAQERVGSAYSTNAGATIDYRITHEKTFIKPFDEFLIAGRWLSFNCALPVAVDAPASFVSKNNVLEWFVKVRLDFKGWPDWVETVPITILP